METPASSSVVVLGVIDEVNRLMQVVDLWKWCKDTGREACQRRSELLLEIIKGHQYERLKRIVECGWNVNEDVHRPYAAPDRTRRRALDIAIHNNWKEGVNLLIESGACFVDPHGDSMVTYGLDASLYHGFGGEIVDVLLKHGERADCSLLQRVLDHFKTYVKRFRAPRSGDEGMDDIYVEERRRNARHFEVLMAHIEGNGCCWEKLEMQTLLYELISCSAPRLVFYPNVKERCPALFLPEHLDVLYRSGADINVTRHAFPDITDTPLKLHLRRGPHHQNTVRWLIRHGADTSTLHAVSALQSFAVDDTPILLLQAGMAISDKRVHFKQRSKLLRLRKALEESIHFGQALEVDQTWGVFVFEASAQPEKLRATPAQRRRQMADLHEFSDESLTTYPPLPLITDETQHLKDVLQRIQRMIDFCEQPRSLQWHCRHSVRNCLVSLEPFAVKTLPGPAMLKRYILCHDV